MTAKLSVADLASNKFVVLATYRHLLRATRIAFQGDNDTLIAARTQARTNFRANTSVDPGSDKAGRLIEHAQGVTQILRENVVQGRRKAKGEETYKLKIHEHTQKLDNETAKTFKGKTKSFKEIKDAQF